jgi:hypothetical protein
MVFLNFKNSSETKRENSLLLYFFLQTNWRLVSFLEHSYFHQINFDAFSYNVFSFNLKHLRFILSFLTKQGLEEDDFYIFFCHQTNSYLLLLKPVVFKRLNLVVYLNLNAHNYFKSKKINFELNLTTNFLKNFRVLIKKQLEFILRNTAWLLVFFEFFSFSFGCYIYNNQLGNFFRYFYQYFLISCVFFEHFLFFFITKMFALICFSNQNSLLLLNLFLNFEVFDYLTAFKVFNSKKFNNTFFEFLRTKKLY